MPNSDDYPGLYSEEGPWDDPCWGDIHDWEYEVDDEEYKTILEWNSEGKVVKKGEKGWNLPCRGRIVFENSQTVPFDLFYISKKNGKFRRIFSLYKEQKAELRRLIPQLETILLKLDKNKVNYGFIRNRNCVQHAMQHIGYNYTISMDLENFFESVTPKHIEKYVSDEIIETCFISGAPQQGLPTSPIIANLAFLNCDQKILDVIKKYNIEAKYTRYADDLVFSFDSKRDIGKIIFLVTKVVGTHGFKINRRKTTIQNIKNGRIVITGVGIDSRGVYPTRKTLKKIRAAEHKQNKTSALGLKEWAKCNLPKKI